VASLSQGRTAAAQCGLFTHKSVPVIFEPPCIYARINHYSQWNLIFPNYVLKNDKIAKLKAKRAIFDLSSIPAT